MKIKLNNKKGFTLVEMLVAVSILILILVGAVNVEVNNNRLATLNKHQLQAINLAQAQLNLVKTIRDNNLSDDPSNPFVGIKIENIIKYLEKDASGNWQLKPCNPTTCPGDSREMVIESDGIKYKVQIKINTAD